MKIYNEPYDEEYELNPCLARGNKEEKFIREKLYILSIFLFEILSLVEYYKEYFDPESEKPDSFIQQIIEIQPQPTINLQPTIETQPGEKLSDQVHSFLEKEWLPIVSFASANMARIRATLMTDFTKNK